MVKVADSLSDPDFAATIWSSFRKYSGLTQTSYFLKPDFLKQPLVLKIYAQTLIYLKRISYSYQLFQSQYFKFTCQPSDLPFQIES